MLLVRSSKKSDEIPLPLPQENPSLVEVHEDELLEASISLLDQTCPSIATNVVSQRGKECAGKTLRIPSRLGVRPRAGGERSVRWRTNENRRERELACTKIVYTIYLFDFYINSSQPIADVIYHGSRSATGICSNSALSSRFGARHIVRNASMKGTRSPPFAAEIDRTCPRPTVAMRAPTPPSHRLAHYGRHLGRLGGA